jgi:hypothetical protein
MHVPRIEKAIGMKPLWAMGFGEKSVLYEAGEGVPWSTKFSIRSFPLHCSESLSMVGIEKSSELNYRLERECFPSLSEPLSNLKPVYVERLYSSEDGMIMFSVLTPTDDGSWLLRCGNQNNSTDKWNTDFQLRLEDLNQDLLNGKKFPQLTKRFLRLRWPLVFEVNDYWQLKGTDITLKN